MEYLLEENKKKLEDIHYANFELLKEVDRIFNKHNLQYFMCGGTLLGAIRHHDFIPWDDDVDILMTRDVFERMLREHILDDLSDDFEVVYPTEGNHFFDMIIKINYKKSRLEIPNEKTKYYNEKHNKISLDIFILDKTYKGLKGKIQRFKLKMIYGQAMSKRCEIDYSKYSFAEKMKIKFLTFLGKRKTVEKLYKKYDKISSKYNGTKAPYYFASNDLLTFIDKLFPLEYFSSSVRVEMRKEKLPAPIEYHKYLTLSYGDYMTLPPENERVPLHIKFDEVKVDYLNK